jgi:hypothetical protein
MGNELARARRFERANPHQLTRRMAGRISRFELARQASETPLATVPVPVAHGTHGGAGLI